MAVDLGKPVVDEKGNSVFARQQWHIKTKTPKETAKGGKYFVFTFAETATDKWSIWMPEVKTNPDVHDVAPGDVVEVTPVFRPTENAGKPPWHDLHTLALVTKAAEAPAAVAGSAGTGSGSRTEVAPDAPVAEWSLPMKYHIMRNRSIAAQSRANAEVELAKAMLQASDQVFVEMPDFKATVIEQIQRAHAAIDALIPIAGGRGPAGNPDEAKTEPKPATAPAPTTVQAPAQPTTPQQPGFRNV